MAKYIDVDKLKKFIETIGLTPQKSADYNDGRDDVKRMVLDFIDSLQQEQPSLPSNLDGAANKFAVSYDQGTCDGIAQECFKAGAEWMTEQGVCIPAHIFMPCEIKDVYDSSKGEYPAAIHPDCGGSLVLERYLKDFKHNDRVIVQIRKKEE